MSEPFDTNAHELFLGLDSNLSDTTSNFGEYSYRHGDILSNVSGGLRNDRYDAEALDPTFNSECQLGCSYVYRQSGNTHLANIGLSFPFDGYSIDVAMGYLHADGDNDRSYQDTIFEVGLIWNF